MGHRPVLALLEILRGEGVDRSFGNPGTTELPFLTALSETPGAPQYVLGVHEGAVVAAADGYDRGTPSPSRYARPPGRCSCPSRWTCWRRTPLSRTASTSIAVER